MKRAPIIFISLTLLLASCSLVDSDRPRLSLATDSESYDLRSDESITVEVENISSSVIYFNRCMPARIEELEGSRIGAFIGFPVCYCLCLAELKPNEKWRYSAPVAWIRQNRDRFELGEDNTYRFHLAFYEDKRMRTPITKSRLYTNHFVLRD